MSDSLESEIAALKQAVAGQNSVIAGATTLLDGLSKQLVEALASARNAGATGEQLAALHDVVNSVTLNTSALASAVQANTPAAQPLPSDNASAVAQQAANTIGTAQAVTSSDPAPAPAGDPAAPVVPVPAPAAPVPAPSAVADATSVQQTPVPVTSIAPPQTNLTGS